MFIIHAFCVGGGFQINAVLVKSFANPSFYLKFSLEESLKLGRGQTENFWLT